MNKIIFWSTSRWNLILVISVIFAAFVLPVLPFSWQGIIFRTSYSFICVSAIFSLEKRTNRLIILFFTTFLLEWISGIYSMEVIYIISRVVNVLFFLVIVVLLIRQIAKSKEVTETAILGSIAGYLLIGMVYSIFITIIIKNDIGSYSNLPPDIVQNGTVKASVPLYYSFVTLASLGYGDICPLKPISRSLATLIAVSGQFYIAVIVALLVGKFSSRQESK
jgi:voltage-gated potassium channel